MNGRIFLTVEIETSNGSVVVMEPVDLRDDGFGGESGLIRIECR